MEHYSRCSDRFPAFPAPPPPEAGPPMPHPALYYPPVQHSSYPPASGEPQAFSSPSLPSLETESSFYPPRSITVTTKDLSTFSSSGNVDDNPCDTENSTLSERHRDDASVEFQTAARPPHHHDPCYPSPPMYYYPPPPPMLPPFGYPAHNCHSYHPPSYYPAAPPSNSPAAECTNDSGSRPFPQLSFPADDGLAFVHDIHPQEFCDRERRHASVPADDHEVESNATPSQENEDNLAPSDGNARGTAPKPILTTYIRPKITSPALRDCREHKNSQARARAKRRRALVALIEGKRESERTPEERNILAKTLASRQRKNGRSRVRAVEMREKIEGILNKPEKERSQRERDFLELHHKRKKRKNEGDRLRRQNQKERAARRKPKKVVQHNGAYPAEWQVENRLNQQHPGGVDDRYPYPAHNMERPRYPPTQMGGQLSFAARNSGEHTAFHPPQWNGPPPFGSH